eukprot:TRINITY_DN35922_c0_g1_i1.p1 TRINITY_DN35922_c0_g1~~TRINITY_DN35922_c0_g1_i1.p1  ORF type:complete len:378 (-),score=67.72 TRINITY_DN35922_c0_g1_i1:26-1159(-)
MAVVPSTTPIETPGRRLKLLHEIPVTQTNAPILSYNNLSFGSGKLAFTAKSDVIIVGVANLSTSSPPSRAKLGLPPSCLPLNSAITPTAVGEETNALVVLTQKGSLQWWSVVDEVLRVTFAVPSFDEGGPVLAACPPTRVFHNGADAVALALSSGYVMVACLGGSGASVRGRWLAAGDAPAAVAASAGTTGLFAISDQGGSVSVWSMASATPVRLAAGTFQGQVCTSLRFVGTRWLVAVTGHGCLRVIDLASLPDAATVASPSSSASGESPAASPTSSGGSTALDVRVEVDAHTQWVYAMDVAGTPEDFRVATVAEDRLLCVWRCRLTDEGTETVVLSSHALLRHVIPTGVAFGPDGMLAVACFDHPNLLVFEGDAD